MNKPYQFAFHERVVKEPPKIGFIPEMFERLSKGEKLNRINKNELFHHMQSNTSKHNYRLLGYVFPFKQFMKTYLVKYKYESNIWREIVAFDKTCIRYSYYTNKGILTIKELK